MNRDHRYNTPEEKAYAAVLQAAKGLDREDEQTGLLPIDAWHEYQRAYFQFVEVVRS